ncbi:IPT/TIG domain-containing protein [Terriglobus albidus]|uniref:IPT/TIG domain-containing protein n=1 Tax=Terriglobus albidus TaxID=1592106 RepID=UPI0021E07F45|nr:IPT/TIG domain-containing protein [Terriglobus albidus]
MQISRLVAQCLRVLTLVAGALISCAVPALAAVVVTTPTNGSTVGTSFPVVATTNTTCSQGVAAVGIYVDDKLQWSANGTTVNTTITLTPGAHYVVVQNWDYCGGATKTGLNLNVSDNSTLPGSSLPGTPHINYTDLNVGSGSGGDNGNGVYVRIFGNNFGASQGTSTATLGGQLVTDCSLCSWSDTMIIAQLGPSAKTGNIVVNVNGLPSNGVPFTVTPTTIVFVSPKGLDTNNGSFTAPFIDSCINKVLFEA